MKIEELNLSLRAYNGLKRSRIDRVEQLVGKSKEDLMRLRGIGLHSACEIYFKVKSLKMTNADRIRGMSDKELANMITGLMSNEILLMDKSACLKWLTGAAVEEE